MITAHKYLNLDVSVINISALIIEKLRMNDSLKHDELFSKVVNSLGKNAKENFLYSLNFLFLLNKIDYFPNSDTFRLHETK